MVSDNGLSTLCREPEAGSTVVSPWEITVDRTCLRFTATHLEAAPPPRARLLLACLFRVWDCAPHEKGVTGKMYATDYTRTSGIVTHVTNV